MKAAGSNFPEKTATISLGVAQLIGTIIAAILVDRKGRKFLLVMSTLGCALSHATLILYMQLHDHGVNLELLHWVPVLCLTLATLFASVGLVPLTLVSKIFEIV